MTTCTLTPIVLDQLQPFITIGLGRAGGGYKASTGLAIEGVGDGKRTATPIAGLVVGPKEAAVTFVRWFVHVVSVSCLGCKVNPPHTPPML